MSLPDVPEDDFSVLDLVHKCAELHVDGVIVPVGGLTSVGPASHATSAFLRVADAARSAEMAVVARIDTSPPPDGDVSDATEEPGSDERGDANGAGAPCINSGHFVEKVPQMVAVTASRLSPDLLLDGDWSGSDASRICGCAACESAFQEAMGRELPGIVDWGDPDYRAWVHWGRGVRAEIWRRNQGVAARAGSAWSGLVPLGRRRRARRLQDEAVKHAGAVVFAEDDEQSAQVGRFRSQVDDLRFLQGVTGGARIALLMDNALRTSRQFRHVVAPQEEARLRLVTSLAADASPAIGLRTAPTGDRRADPVARAVLGQNRLQEGRLTDSEPVAEVALVYSQVTAESWAGSHRGLLSDAPYRGMMRAVGEARCHYIPIAMSAIPELPSSVRVLVLPNVAVMSDEEAATVRSFVEAGGTLIATGETSLYDAEGNPRQDFALADVFGASIRGHVPDRLAAITRITPRSRTDPPGPALGLLKGPATEHSYLRCSPGRHAAGSSPDALIGPDGDGLRHPALAGLEETDIVAFGGMLNPLKVSADCAVPLTFIPPFPNFPIDDVYPREEHASIPGLVIGEFGSGRAAFLPADIDRRYGIDPVPDHGLLLRNLVSWALGDSPELSVDGVGSILTCLYRSGVTRVLHIVNTTGCDNQAAPVSKTVPAGPFLVSLPATAAGTNAIHLLASGATVEPRTEYAGGRRRIFFEVPRVVDQEIAVIA